jgi:hypothetical protein
MQFMLRSVTHERLKDSKGRLIPTVICEHISDSDKERIAAQKTSDEDAVLELIDGDPKISQASIASELGWTLFSGEPHKTKAARCITTLMKQKLIKEMPRNKGYKLTPEGKKALGKRDGGDDDDE